MVNMNYTGISEEKMAKLIELFQAFVSSVEKVANELSKEWAEIGERLSSVFPASSKQTSRKQTSRKQTSPKRKYPIVRKIECRTRLFDKRVKVVHRCRNNC